MVKYLIEVKHLEDFPLNMRSLIREQYGDDIEDSWLFYSNGVRAKIKRGGDGGPSSAIAQRAEHILATRHPENVKAAIKILSQDIRTDEAKAEIVILAEHFEVELEEDYF